MSARPLLSVAAAVAVLAVSSVALAGGTLSVDAPFRANDQVIGIKYDVKVPIATATGGGATGRPIQSPVCVIKAPGATSSQYFKAAMTGMRLRTVTFSGPGGVTLKLENAMVSSYALNGADGKDLEEVCFSPQKLTFTSGGQTFVYDFVRGTGA